VAAPTRVDPEPASDHDGRSDNPSRDSRPLETGRSVVVFIDADVARGGDGALNVTCVGE
jgi:hypothetical protein